MKDGRAPCHKLAFEILTTICNIHPIIYARTYLCIRVTSLTAPLFHIYRWNAWASYLRMSRWVFVANSGTLRYRNRVSLLTYSTSFRMFFSELIYDSSITEENNNGDVLFITFFLYAITNRRNVGINRLMLINVEKVAISFRASSFY